MCQCVYPQKVRGWNFGYLVQDLSHCINTYCVNFRASCVNFHVQVKQCLSLLYPQPWNLWLCYFSWKRETLQIEIEPWWGGFLASWVAHDHLSLVMWALRRQRKRNVGGLRRKEISLRRNILLMPWTCRIENVWDLDSSGPREYFCFSHKMYGSLF